MRVVLCVIGLAFASGDLWADDWRPVFNGKDLTGWRANNDPDSFAVKEGVLHVQASGKTAAHLFYPGDLKDGVEKFTNFELELTARAEPKSNSGIFIHSDVTAPNQQKHLDKGYEVQLNSTQQEKRKTGSLYAVNVAVQVHGTRTIIAQDSSVSLESLLERIERLEQDNERLRQKVEGED